ncbi:MAG: hypothetical protein EON87_02980 [Brevundimonas sp.]|nr:MAG: hypothetical protein EON87_02980 [Brevundimonas sp.]
MIILRHALPDSRLDDVADLPLGQRNGLLMQVRRELFGSTLDIRVPCPKCREPVVVEVSIDDILPEGWSPAGPSAIHLNIGPLQIEARPPRTRDLAGIQPDDHSDTTRRVLIERSVLKVLDGAREVPTHDLDDAAIAVIAEALANADPLADIRLSLECPSCATPWMWRFGIADLLWRELTSKVEGLFDEVHDLAIRYGWSEADILSMTSARRTAYLARLRA